MSYPRSSEVSAGDATLASHYNHLRSDALLLGQEPEEAVPLGALLERYESRLNLARIGSDRLRVLASPSAPVSLMVAGCMLQAAADVDLDANHKPSGAPATFYVFANRSAGSASFTLSVSDAITELANQRRIGRFYWDGSQIVKDSVRTEAAVLTADLLRFLEPAVCEGRLTLSTAVPLPTADIDNSANLYFTPYSGARISLYVPNYGWRIYPFPELAASLAPYGAHVNLDVFIYDDEGVLSLELTEWSNDSLRAIALARQDGTLVKANAPTHRYVGTVRTAEAGKSCDTSLKRFVWNCYNRLERPLLVKETTDSWTYATANIWRPLNNSLANRVQFVIGVDETLVKLSAHVLCENSGNNGMAVGISLDDVNLTHAQIMRGVKGLNATYNFGWYGSDYSDYPGVGFHFLQLIEYVSGGTGTFYGDKGTAPEIVSGAMGSLVM